VHQLLVLACRRVEGAPDERQGAGAIDAGAAVALAANDEPDVEYPAIATVPSGRRLRFCLQEPDAHSVELRGSWDRWAGRVAATRVAPSLWQMTAPRLSAGTYQYKLVVDNRRWIDDPANRRRSHDGFGGTNSVFEVR
jgi:plastocyanin